MSAVRSMVQRLSVYRYVKGILPTDWWRYCRGVYPTYQEAHAAIRKGRRVGFDHNDIARAFFLTRLKPSDYAALYWLNRLLPTLRSVFDLGGSLGTAYYNFKDYLEFPVDLRWLVCEVAAVADEGRKLAAERNAAQLEFTANFTDGDGFDALHTAGTLQFFEGEFADVLTQWKNLPRHILVNRVPLTDGETFFTVQDSEHTSVPYRVGSRADFIAGLQNRGYEMVDAWACPESWCSVLLHKSRTVAAYSGFYFRLVM